MFRKNLKIIWLVLILVSIPIFLDIFNPALFNQKELIKIFLLVLFFLLGLILLIMVLKQGKTWIQNRFIVLAAANAMIIPAAMFIHNSSIASLVDHEAVYFFIIVKIICPAGFLAGTIGSLILIFKPESRNKVNAQLKNDSEKEVN